jgi:hypothetical protein
MRGGIDERGLVERWVGEVEVEVATTTTMDDG